MHAATPSWARSHCHHRLSSRRQAGFSMTELTIVISVLGILATITLTSFSHLLDGGKDALAAERREALNQALYRYAQYNVEMIYARKDSDGTDESVALRTIQYRNPDEDRAKIGSPYFDPRYNPITSGDITKHRLRWTGSLFELLKPGTAGIGFLMNFDGTDFTVPFNFPANFQPGGY